MDSKYTTFRVPDLEKELRTSSSLGLSGKEIRERQAHYGPNVVQHERVTGWSIFVRQFKTPFIYLLMGAAVISLCIGHIYEASIIIFITLLNIVLGFFQEYRAKQAVDALRNFLISRTRVRRDNKEQVIDSRELVPGDIVLFEAGSEITADVRFTRGSELMVDESILSGESTPLSKISDPLSAEQSHDAQKAANIGFAGTTLVGGEGEGIVIAIGNATEFGNVVALSNMTAHESNFYSIIARLSRSILIFMLSMVAVVFVLYLVIKGDAHIGELLLFAIALAITITPEALPVVTTFSLSRGALQLAHHDVVVRRLSSIEDLGSINILCTDKTGTLTENILTIADQWPANDSNLLLYGLVGSNNFEALTEHTFEGAIWHALSHEQQQEIKQWQLTDTIPFDYDRLYATLMVCHNNEYFLIVRGVYENVAALCAPFSTQGVQQWVIDQGNKGRRTWAIAYKKITSHTKIEKQDEQDLTFAGVIAFEDPIKRTVDHALAQARIMGIAIKVITGDSKEVAGAVATQIGLIPSPEHVVMGEMLDKASPEEKKMLVSQNVVFARISPKQKFEIIEMLKTDQNIVGCLGDGINDVPALKEAHVGIVVQQGVDIAKDAADIVLLKKSLSVIIDGVTIGRTVFANTMKYITVTLTSTFGNFYSVALISLFIDFLPMLPLQILLVNFLADLPMIFISTDTVDVRELRRPIEYNNRAIIRLAIIFGMVASCFDFIFFGIFHGKQPEVIQTSWFMLNIFTELLFIFSIRTHAIFYRAPRPSLLLLASSVAIAFISGILPFTAWGRSWFSFAQITIYDLGIVIGLSLIYFMVNECVKQWYYYFFYKRIGLHVQRF